MNTKTISEVFAEAKKNNQSVFIPYICAGDMNVEFSFELAKTLIENGAQMLEIGIPFSDPIADGTTIRMASRRSLKSGMNVEKAFELIKKINSQFPQVPLLIMTYYNIVYARGIEKFTRDAKESGAGGFVIPDLPIDESGELGKMATQNNIDLIYFITINQNEERMKKTFDMASGFVYAVPVLGTTGVRENVSKQGIELIDRAKKINSKVPIAIGFGISSVEQTREYYAAGANGIIIGSKIIDIYRLAKNDEEALRKVGEFTKDICRKENN